MTTTARPFVFQRRDHTVENPLRQIAPLKNKKANPKRHGTQHVA
jgi:hypothetical protein